MSQLGQTGSAEQESVLLQVFEGIASEALETLPERRLCGVHVANNRIAPLPDPHRDQSLADVHPVAGQADDVALLHFLHQERPDPIDERDPRVGQDQGTEVRVPTADRCRGVHDGGHAGFDQSLSRHPVEVFVIDHRRRRVPPSGRDPSFAGRRARRRPPLTASSRPPVRPSSLRGRRVTLLPASWPAFGLIQASRMTWSMGDPVGLPGLIGG